MMRSSSSDKGDNKEKARQAALRKLSSGDRTEKEILDVLSRWGCSSEESSEIIDEFKEWGYLDDEKYCLRYFEYASSKGKALARIVRELVQKGISAEKVRAVLDDVPADERGKALAAAMKMARSQAEIGKPLDDKFLTRVGRRLSSLGYDSGICYFVIGKIREYAKEINKEDE